jgi:hypothetical protein
METTIGNDGGRNYYVDTAQDTDPRFTYFPSDDAWSKVTEDVGSYLGSSGQ